MAISETLRIEKPIQLRLGWEKQEREKRDLENAQRRRRQVREFALDWISRHPGKKVSPRVIAQGMGFSQWTARRRVKEVLDKDPELIGVIKKEREKNHNTKSPAEGWSLSSLGSYSVAYKHPDRFVSLGRTLRDFGIRMTPGSATEILAESGIEVKVFEATYPRIGLTFYRYIVRREDLQRINNTLH